MEIGSKKKFMLFALVVLFGAFALAVAASVWNIIPAQSTVAFVEFLANGNLLLRILIGLGLISIAVATLSLFISICKNNNKTVNFQIDSGDNSNSAFISGHAIDSLVQRCISGNKQIKKCNCSVAASDLDGMIIRLKLVVVSDSNLPSLCTTLRQSIIQYIKQITGIDVLDVTISIIGTVVGNTTAETERRVN